ncbi:transposase [Marispirochaeta sp.]|uniref:transposase n=1 Tax=Marispirochaeta sp. TaxID=2038653 RepID=UPI003747F146
MRLSVKNFMSQEGKLKGPRYTGSEKYCGSCELRAKCLRNRTSKFRQVAFLSPNPERPDYLKMARDKFDTPSSRSMYAKRMGTVEPVFRNLSRDKQLARFTVRGEDKVNPQWRLYCMVHNIGKLRCRFR